jgi:hypothetical protein
MQLFSSFDKSATKTNLKLAASRIGCGNLRCPLQTLHEVKFARLTRTLVLFMSFDWSLAVTLAWNDRRKRLQQNFLFVAGTIT